MTLTLFLAPGSSSMAPHIALHEAGAQFDIRPISFAKREHRDPAYLAVNPEGKVPTLLVDGSPLTEVAAILFYIARRFPEAGLLPSPGTLEAEAQAIACMSFIASTIHPLSREGGEAARRAYAHAEQRLAGREWLLGGRMTIADIHLFRLFWRNRERIGLSADQYPALTMHFERMMDRPAVKKTCEIEAGIGYELPA